MAHDIGHKTLGGFIRLVRHLFQLCVIIVVIAACQMLAAARVATCVGVLNGVGTAAAAAALQISVGQ